MGLLDALSKFATPDNLQLLGAGLKDLGDPGANNLTKVSDLIRQRRAQQGLLASLFDPMSDVGGIAQGAPVPQDGGYHGIGPGEDGAPLSKPAAPTPRARGVPTLRSALPAILQAQSQGADVGGIVQLLSSMQPKVGISGDQTYTQSDDGTITWGPQRPMTQREKLELERMDRKDARDDAYQKYRDEALQSLIDYRNGQLGLGRGRLAVSQARASRAGGSRGAGSPVAPPGYRPRQAQ